MMEPQKEQIKQFALDFFKNIKCILTWEGSLLVVTSIPADFEEFIGKKGPYHLSFEPDPSHLHAEVLTKGSYLLKSMATYLESKGQTTLTRLCFDTDPAAEITKRYRLNNVSIANVTRKNKFNTILSFTFMTTFQYLNEKEQVMQNVCTENGEIIELDMTKYLVKDGKKEEVSVSNVEAEYASAKDYLRSRLQTKVNEISTVLKTKLDKELARIKQHYGQQCKELDDSLARQASQIHELQNQLTKSPISEHAALTQKIKKIEDSLKQIQDAGTRDKIVKEEQFFFTDERHKHSLNMSNKLMNTTIMYYPVETWIVFFKSQDAGRMVEMHHNPLKNTLSPCVCDACKTPLTSLLLCSSGHLTCPTCLTRCSKCAKETCKHCTLKSCDHCGRQLCKKCVVRCATCSKAGCQTHLSKNPFTGTESCQRCLLSCTNCSQLTDKAHSKPCPSCSKLYCIRCAPTSLRRSPSGIICTACAQECTLCSRILKKDQFPPCKECKLSRTRGLNSGERSGFLITLENQNLKILDVSSCNHSRICITCRNKIGVRAKPR